MHISVEEYTLMRRTTLRELRYRAKSSCYYYRVYRRLYNGDYLAVISRRRIPSNVFVLVLSRVSRVPLWKQSMQMQMGSLPTTEPIERINIPVEEVTEEVEVVNLTQCLVFEYK